MFHMPKVLNRVFAAAVVFVVLVVFVACAAPTPKVVEKQVVVTQVIEKQIVVTQVVEKPVVEKPVVISKPPSTSMHSGNESPVAAQGVQ